VAEELRRASIPAPRQPVTGSRQPATGPRPPETGPRQPATGPRVPGNDWSVFDGMVPAGHPLVSVIVVHYEQPDDLARTLRSLARQTYQRLEIIVVDDGSAAPPAVPEGVTLVRQPDLGFRAAAARNAGAARASGSVLCFLDADTAPEPGYIAALIRLPALRDDAVVVGRRRHARFGVDDLEPVETSGPAAELPEPAWLRDAYADSGDLLRADHRTYRFVISAVLACSRSFFEATGGFDERFDRYGGEDWEWAHRAWTNGALVAHVPSAVAWHNGADAAGRGTDSAELTARMNHEALTLLDRIGVPGSVGRGIRSAAVDILIDLPSGGAAATVVCADLLLEALPTARVLVDDEVARLVSGDDRVIGRSAWPVAGQHPRVRISGDGLFTVARGARSSFCEALARATEEVGVGTLGWVTFSAGGGGGSADDGGSAGGNGGGPTLTVAAARAEARRTRRPDAEEFRTEHRIAPLEAFDTEPHVAAHLGGWNA
jgi:GT2 family glycosyltransferase